MMDATLDVATSAEGRASGCNFDADAEIEEAEDAHGYNKENEGGHLDQRPLGRLRLHEQRAESRFGYWTASQIGSGFLRVFHVGDARVDGERQGADERHHPNEGHDSGGSP